MLENNISYIANYLWQQSMDNINQILSGDEIINFNLNDYYYLTSIYQMGSPNFGQVAEALNLSKPAISALVKRLIKNGLIEKVQSKEDKRVYYLEVTEKGIEIIEGDNKLYSKLTTLISQIFTEEQFKEFDNLFGRVVSALRKDNKNG